MSVQRARRTGAFDGVINLPVHEPVRLTTDDDDWDLSLLAKGLPLIAVDLAPDDARIPDELHGWGYEHIGFGDLLIKLGSLLPLFAPADGSLHGPAAEHHLGLTTHLPSGVAANLWLGCRRDIPGMLYFGAWTVELRFAGRTCRPG